MTDDVRDRIERAFRDVHPPQDSRDLIGVRAQRIKERHRLERGLIALVVIAGVIGPSRRCEIWTLMAESGRLPKP